MEKVNDNATLVSGSHGVEPGGENIIQMDFCGTSIAQRDLDTIWARARVSGGEMVTIVLERVSVEMLPRLIADHGGLLHAVVGRLSDES